MSTAIAALPFFGGEMSSFDTTFATVMETTSSGSYNSSYSRCSISLRGKESYMSTPSWPSASNFWTHWVGVAIGGAVNSYPCPMIYFYSGSTLVAKMYFSQTSGVNTVISIQTLQSGSLTSAGSGSATYAYQTYSQGLTTVDVNLVAGSSGSVSVYAQGVLIFSTTSLNHSGWAGVTSMQIYGYNDGGGDQTQYVSQIICDISSTVGRYLITENFTNESATNNQWTGSGGASNLADINEIVLDDSTYIYAASTGLTDTFYQSGLSLGTYNILAVGVSARARVQGAGPANIKLALRTGSANYVSTAIALNAGFQACFNSWTTNPATSSAWTASAAQAAESGVQSLT